MKENAYKILVIDDNVSDAQFLTMSLKNSLPCKTEFVTNARSAIKKNQAQTFDLIITDFIMPKQDGLALLAEIKALFPDREVIVTTAFPQITTAVEAMKIGAVDYLGKEEVGDFWVEKIIASVKYALDTRLSRRTPGFYRENLIQFFLARTKSFAGPQSVQIGTFPDGLALEYVVKLLLESCDGFNTTFHRLRTKNEEHDVVCVNEAAEEFWRRQGPVILIECKDFAKSLPGDKDRGRLEQKIRNRQGQSTVGLFVSPSGFTKPFLTPISQTPVPGGTPPIIIPIDKQALIDWISSYDRLKWLTARAIDSIF